MDVSIHELSYLVTSPFPLSLSLLTLPKVQDLATLSKGIHLRLMEKETLDETTQLAKLVLVSFFSLIYHSLKDKLRQVKILEFM